MTWSLIGLAVGRGFFPRASVEVALFLMVLPQLPTLAALLDRNRDEVYRKDGSRIKANRDLAGALLAIFLGIFGAFVLAVALAPGPLSEPWFEPLLGGYAAQRIEQVDFGRPGPVFGFNALVFGVAFLVALLYREGGLLLVLGWNASRWGVIFAYMALMAEARGAGSVAGYLASTAIVVLPHLVLEALAYVLGAMSGVFLSKGLAKYPLRSAIFADVLVWGVLRIALVGLLVLGLAAIMEASWAPAMVAWLFPG